MEASGNLNNLLGMARTALMGGNNQEALEYFNRVLEIDPTLAEAWVGKGKAAAWQSNLVNIRLPEALVSFQHGIANADSNEKDAVTDECVDEVNRVAVAVYGIARNHMIEFVSLDNSWGNYLGQVAQLIDALESIRIWSPRNRNTLDNIVHFCKDNIEGYSFRDPYNNNMPAAHGITSDYESFLRERMNTAIEGIRAIEPGYTPPTIEKKQADACFVVTATMGDFDHPDVALLRRFRDEWLRKISGGGSLIKAYYQVGPFLAALIEGSRTRRRISYQLIVKPAVRFARNRLRP